MFKNYNLINTNEILYNDMLSSNTNPSSKPKNNKSNSKLVNKLYNTNEIFYKDMFK